METVRMKVLDGSNDTQTVRPTLTDKGLSTEEQAEEHFNQIKQLEM